MVRRNEVQGIEFCQSITLGIFSCYECLKPTVINSNNQEQKYLELKRQIKLKKEANKKLKNENDKLLEQREILINTYEQIRNPENLE